MSILYLILLDCLQDMHTGGNWWDLIWQLDINKTPTTEKYVVITKQCLQHDNCLLEYSFVIYALNIHDASNVHPLNEALIYLLI